jgi:hypothetical protein
MEGMVVCCRGSLVGRRASAPPEAGEGIASSNYERKGSRIGGLLAGFGADRIIRRVGVHDRYAQEGAGLLDIVVQGLLGGR